VNKELGKHIWEISRMGFVQELVLEYTVDFPPEKWVTKSRAYGAHDIPTSSSRKSQGNQGMHTSRTGCMPITKMTKTMRSLLLRLRENCLVDCDGTGVVPKIGQAKWDADEGSL
jgi:hypothetical protein